MASMAPPPKPKLPQEFRVMLNLSLPYIDDLMDFVSHSVEVEEDPTESISKVIDSLKNSISKLDAINEYVWSYSRKYDQLLDELEVEGTPEEDAEIRDLIDLTYDKFRSNLEKVL